MSDRERWIVYPLLFLALGLALRDKLTQVIQCETLICNRLQIEDRQGQPVLVAEAEYFGRRGQRPPTPDSLDSAGALMIVGRDGEPVAMMADSGMGGYVSLFDRQRRLRVDAGHFLDGIGMRTVNRENRPVAPSPFVYRARRRPAQPPRFPGEPPAPETQAEGTEAEETEAAEDSP
ncbi:MAG: hypothetical protein WDZ59_15235 [Pirellulales bacterium]